MSSINSSHSVVLGRPPSYFVKWPQNLAVPEKPGPVWFGSWYDTAMDGRTPLIIAGTYALLAHWANHIRKTNKKPLAFTNTWLFKYLVLAHNIFLCIYSAWTCVGMTSSIAQTVYNITRAGLRQTVDDDGMSAYLRGDATLYEGISGRWFGFWRGLCDLDEGVWDRGLSYYGYFFYLSKFYEVFDTMIILAKGRPSSTLQTYHHAGAMLSMWAGMRYASPPIWIFVVFNSLIHTIMYFYYTLSALKIRVPKILKQCLTTAQITQFIVGGSLATLHMFVYYFDPNTGNHCACLKNSGQTFAVLFNVFYLTPLTWLFVNFWIKSYRNKASAAAAAEKAKKNQ